jgi:hypothetical protein
MKKSDVIFLLGLVVLSALASFVFISYGMSIILSDKTAQGPMVFAYVTTGYGLANVAILSIAWSSREAWSNGASKFIAMCYLGVFVMDTINAGMKSALGVVGILTVVLVLFVNCFTVKKIVDRE